MIWVAKKIDFFGLDSLELQEIMQNHYFQISVILRR